MSAAVQLHTRTYRISDGNPHFLILRALCIYNWCWQSNVIELWRSRATQRRKGATGKKYRLQTSKMTQFETELKKKSSYASFGNLFLIFCC